MKKKEASYPSSLIGGFSFLFGVLISGFFSKDFLNEKISDWQISKDQIMFFIPIRMFFFDYKQEIEKNKNHKVFFVKKKEKEVICRMSDTGLFLLHQDQHFFIILDQYQMTERKLLLENMLAVKTKDQVFVLAESYPNLPLCLSSPKIVYGAIR